MAIPRTLIVEGWTGIAHSYSLVNHFQLMELIKRPELRVFYRDAPFPLPQWKKMAGMFDAKSEAAIASIPAPSEAMRADALYRISYPLDLSSAPHAEKFFVFGTAEAGCVPLEGIRNQIDVERAQRENERLLFVTPSQWSKEGFIASGADAKRVFLVPHGVATETFHPVDPEQKQRLRKEHGLDGFVFLNVGAVTPNKGMDQLLSAFAQVAEKFPEACLVIKGSDALYPSREFLDQSISKLSEKQLNVVGPRLPYVGKSLGQEEMARMYQMCDAYVSPYHAEAFNMPVLEAAASGLPVICTSGGPTDEFTTGDFALPIEAEVMALANGKVLMPDVDSIVQQMTAAIERSDFREKAMQAGPEFVRWGFTWKHAVDRLVKVLFPLGG